MTKERRLGRGLEALLGRPLLAPHEEPGSPAAGGPLELNVYQIDANPFQPRRDVADAAIDELAASIRAHGVLQPLVVRQTGGRYQLIAGERRLRAAIKAGLTSVPVTLRTADDRQVAELALVENLQREDLHALDKAASFRQYLERYRTTQEELAARLGIDRSTVANLIRLLELPEGVQQALRAGTITAGHARALLPLGEEREQVAMCQRIAQEALSVRATEEIVQQAIHAADSPTLSLVGRGGPAGKPRSARSDQAAALAQDFRAALGMKVELRQGARGRGKLVVYFNGHEDFERLRAHVCGTAPSAKAG